MRNAFLLLLVCLLAANAADAKLYIATRDIKVMSGKGTRYGVLGTIKSGTKFEAADAAGKWRKVIDEGEVGYINAKYIVEAPPEAPQLLDIQTINKIKEWVNEHLLYSLVGAVALLLILRSMVLSLFAGRSIKLSVKNGKKNKPLIKYWNQCKHSSAVIKNDVEPGSSGCIESSTHLWTNLGEVGQHQYFCKNCGIVVHTKLPPSDLGCPRSTLHRWIKKK